MDTLLTVVVVVEGIAIAVLALVVAHLVVLVKDGEGATQSVLLGISARAGSRHIVPSELANRARSCGVTSLVFLRERCDSCLTASYTLPRSPLAGRVLVVVDGQLPPDAQLGLAESGTAVVQDHAETFAVLGIVLSPLLISFDHSDRVVASEPLPANLTLPSLR